MTSASVVADHAEIAVTFNETSVEASVIGSNPTADVALLRLSEPAPVTVLLTLAEDPARVGSQVGALTQPVGLPQTMIVGRISSIDADRAIPQQILTDTVVSVGSGGGPLIDDRGEVVGIVGSLLDGGDSSLTALSVPEVAPEVEGWATANTAQRAAFCVGDVDLDGIDEVAAELIAADIEHPELAAVRRTYAVYTQSINSSRAAQAFDVLGPAITNADTAERWAQGQQTSKLWDWRVRSIEENGGGLVVRSVFTSTQDAAFAFDQASTCTRWDITHDLVRGTFRDQEYWLINRSRATTAQGPVDCEDWTPERVAAGEFTLGDLGSETANGRLAGGTVNVYTIGVGLVNGNDPDEVVDQSPILFEVTVDAGGSFDATIEINDINGRLLSMSVVDENISTATAEFTVDENTGFLVFVRDAENRSGGTYSVDFSATPVS